MSAFFTLAIISLLGAMSPGPDAALIIRNTLTYSKKTAIYTALGFIVSELIHCTYCILGLAIVIANSIILFNIIKLLGAAYLVYIGVKALLAKEVKTIAGEIVPKKIISPFAAVRQGMLCNLLNPKATLFFLGIFTLVVKPNTPISIQLIYCLEICVVTFLWFAFLAFVLGNTKVKQKLAKVQTGVNKVLGVFLIAFGCKLALLTR